MESTAKTDRCNGLRRSGARGGSRIALGATALASIFLIGGLGSAAAAGALTIQKPWIRLIIKSRPAGGYFTLHNNTTKTVQLTGASSPACGTMMLHQTKEIKGVEHMLPVKSINVPAHGTLSFHPGGYHIMCMKPQASMIVGHKVPVTLKFAGGRKATADFKVEGPGGGSMSMGKTNMGR